MTLTRRSLMQYLALSFPTLFAASQFVACTWSQVWQQIQNYVPVGLQAFNVILTILGSAGVAIPGGSVVSIAINLVKAGFSDLVKFIADYKTADANQKPTVLGHIAAGIEAVEENIQKFWNDLNLPDGSLATTIAGLLGVLTSTLLSFLPKLPTPTTNVFHAKYPKRITAPVKLRTIAEFKQEFNALLPPEHAQLSLK